MLLARAERHTWQKPSVRPTLLLGWSYVVCVIMSVKIACYTDTRLTIVSFSLFQITWIFDLFHCAVIIVYCYRLAGNNDFFYFLLFGQ